MASFSALAIRSLVLILGICKYSDGGSKQILQSLLKQTNYNNAITISAENGSLKETKPPIYNSSPAQEETETSHTKKYKDFHKLFYGEKEQDANLERSSGPNDIERNRMGTMQELEDVRQANEHFLKIRRKGRCRTPISKIIRVKQFHPDASKEYIPRCTILHRCGEDSGCCDNDAFHCVASMVQEVALPFYTLYVGSQGLNVGNTIEKLTFTNHTQCECHPINDQPRIEENVSIKTPQSETHNKGAVHHTSNVQRCRECPIPFYRREYPDGICTCDCFDRQRPCLRIKRGRDPLADVERRCVESGYCHVPECEYGEFDVTTGQCPKRMEFDQRRNRNYPSGHRWSFYERD